MRQPEEMLLVTTSWDDGHPLDLRLAELLEKHGAAATFYVPRASERAVLNAGQIRQLSQRFEIGAHTLDHTYLARVADAEATAQLAGSRRWVEEVTGKPCRTFCFPGGSYRPHQLRLVREAGFDAARTTELLSLQRPRLAGELQLIPTTVQAFPHHPLAYVKNALKRRHISRLFRSGALFRSHGWLGLARRLFFQALEQRGVFHLWGHSWEIEKRNQWPQVADLLATIAAHKKELRFVTNGELCGVGASEIQTGASEAAETAEPNQRSPWQAPLAARAAARSAGRRT